MKTRLTNVQITEPSGKIIFEKNNVEVPEGWSDRAATIAASKYFHYNENSILELVDRVVTQIVSWGQKQGYFNNKEEASRFSESLQDILLNQRAAFNSPVWFNLGVLESDNQTAACFVYGVEDTMDDILDHARRIGLTFKNGSGVGMNISHLRAKGEELSNRGISSGPISFLRIWDQVAGSIKSGGRTRRSAQLIAMDVDHPDIEEFIDCKLHEEDKAKALIAAGTPQEEAYATVAFQNANHSIMLTDEFMNAVLENKSWNLINRKDKQIAKTIKAKDLFHKIAKTAWATGDPGLQFRNRINQDNPVPSIGDIECSNPCFDGKMKLLTVDGYKTFEELDGQEIKIINKDNQVSQSKVWCSGIKPVVEIEFESGLDSIICTSDHIFQTNIGQKKAIDLIGTKLIKFNPEGPNSEGPEVISIVYLDQRKVYDFTEPETHWGIVNGFIAHNCSEHFGVNNSACNLASLNLIKYLKPNNEFDTEQFERDIEIIITAQDIMIDPADYPTPETKEMASVTRPLGLGFANLGAYLMSLGMPYDSDYGRKETAKITRTMATAAYKTSINLAKKLGSYAAYKDNEDRNLEILERLTQNKDLVELAYTFGLRNSQLTCLAPCGTIGFLMDCDTTGIEPLFALEMSKHLSGGGIITITPGCVEVGKTFNDPEVLKTANEISYKGHIDMMATCQQFLNGSISKTINFPADATVEDIEEAYVYAWKKGLKSIAIYRDGSKAMQPLTKSGDNPIVEESNGEQWMAFRRKLPDVRQSITHKFNVAGLKGYLTCGIYEDGDLGEIFIRTQKMGSTVQGLMDGMATAVSLGLQYGVPLEIFVDKFVGSKFEPAGITTNEEIRIAHSVTDYIFRWLSIYFLDEDDDQLKETTSEVKVVRPKISFDGPPCPNCQAITSRAGTCYVCNACGTTTGCS